MANDILLKIEGLRASVEDKEILKGVDLTIRKGEIHAVMGPNGAGKTTIFNLLTSVYQPTRGSILLNGIDTKGMNTAKVNRMGIARTFQNIRLFGEMTALENVKVGDMLSMQREQTFLSSKPTQYRWNKQHGATDKHRYWYQRNRLVPEYL